MARSETRRIRSFGRRGRCLVCEDKLGKRGKVGGPKEYAGMGRVEEWRDALGSTSRVHEKVGQAGRVRDSTDLKCLRKRVVGVSN